MTTPQQVLSEQERLACWTRHTAVEDYKTYTFREHVLRALRDVESVVLAKLQAAPQAQAEQAAPNEAAEHWHRLYLEKCQQYNDRVAQLGAEIEALEAQGVGEVVAWCTPDGERCVTARTYEGARRDGGAIWSSMAPFTVPGYASPAPSPEAVPVPDIKAMANRLMGWKLPQDFSPDCGISFDGRGPDAMGYEKTWPTGTNLLTVAQAEQMLSYLFEDPTFTTQQAHGKGDSHA